VKSTYIGETKRLLDIPSVYDEQGNERARILTLSTGAKEVWLQFSQYIESRQGGEGDLHSIQDWTSKLPGAALRIAGLFHVIEHGESLPTISQETMERSLDLCELLIPHARAVFDLMGTDQAISDGKAILRWLISERKESFTQRECLKRHEGRLKRVDRLKKALSVLAERHIISEPFKTVTGRRPSIHYRVNPLVLTGGAL
jgi:putative DNA primase/helicase